MPTDADRLILIVTGAHLRAETADRPLAYTLQRRMLDWIARRQLDTDPKADHPDASIAPAVVVCSDLWYLNRPELREQPTISIGGPGVNALSAYLGDKLPSEYAVDGVLVIQMDLEMPEAVACCWGTDQVSTAAAVDLFCDKYLDDFMTSATGDWQSTG